jgi:hypothetical protein
MTDRDTGGPAFPEMIAIDVSGDVHRGFSGMTMRDYFAGQAPKMPEQWWEDYRADHETGHGSYAAAIAEWNYHYADAMLKERSK